MNKYLKSYLKQNLKYFKTDIHLVFIEIFCTLIAVQNAPSHIFPQYIKAHEAEEESTSFCRSCCHRNLTELINCPQRDLSDKVCHGFKVLAPFGLSSFVILDWVSSHVCFSFLWKAGAVHELFLTQQRRFTGNKLIKLANSCIFGYGALKPHCL